MDDQLYIYHAEMCKVFSHPKRLELINILRDNEMSTGQPVPTPDHDERTPYPHLKEGRKCGLLSHSQSPLSRGL